MTTAQERRRARRLARAQASAAPVEVVEVVEVVDVVAVDTPAAALPVEAVAEPIAPPTDARTTFGWVAVEPTADSVSARPRPATDNAQSTGAAKRWVAVPARRAPHALSQSSPTVDRSPAAGVLAELPAEPDEHEYDAHEAADAAPSDQASARRALHPKTRAIRITRVKANGRRRWSVDFLVRQPDVHLPK